MTAGELMALPFLFEFWAHPHQLAPVGAWKSWVILGGRGAGKTRAGSEWVRACVEGAKPLEAGRAGRVALVGETIDQVRDVMVFGDSGILECSPPDRRPKWEATRKRLVWPNGAQAQVFSAHDPERLRGPQFDVAWLDEYGCAAIDKGTNQPNKFIDLKSSESALPRASNGRRDDYIQHQYLKAMTCYWGDPAFNPISGAYGGRMVNMARAFVWAWDARPFPAFPNARQEWRDGINYARGHWISGRIASRSLASVVAEICGRSGVASFDVSDLRGMVRGYSVAEVFEARAALQPLMIAYGFDAIERGGTLVFTMRDGAQATELDLDTLAVSPDLEGVTEKTRGAEAETSGRVRVTFVEADADFQARAEEAVLADDATHAISGSEMSLSLTRTEGRQIAEKWLAESRLGRETVRFGLPPSRLAVGAGDVVALPDVTAGDADETGSALYRVDRVEQGALQIVEAVRIEPATYEPSDFDDDPATPRQFVPPVPVTPVFLDLPLMTGDEVPHAPHIAVTGIPWPGSVAVYSAATDANYQLAEVIGARAVMGETLSPMAAAPAGRIDHGAALEIRLDSGGLESVDRARLLAGANLMAIGDGSSASWELFQFETAETVAENVFWLTTRLRGQLGSDAVMPEVWPVGSTVVLISGAVIQLPLLSAQRNLARHYRIGPAQRPFDDPSYRHRVEAFQGIGLRPYAPVHLRAISDVSGEMYLSWVRRTRIDGDSWQAPEAPLGEEIELYQIRVRLGGQIIREANVNAPVWTYSAADRDTDGTDGAAFSVEVAQISARFGAGVFRALDVAV